MGEWVAKMHRVGYAMNNENLKAANINCGTQYKYSIDEPKRPLPAFFQFMHDMRQTTSKKLRLTELAAKYNALSDAERRNYTDRAKENSQRYRYVTPKRKCERFFPASIELY